MLLELYGRGTSIVIFGKIILGEHLQIYGRSYEDKLNMKAFFVAPKVFRLNYLQTF